MYLNGCLGCIPPGVSLGFWKTQNSTNPGIHTYPTFTFDDILCHSTLRADVPHRAGEGSAFTSYPDSKRTNSNHQRTTYIPETKELNIHCETKTDTVINEFNKGDTPNVYSDAHAFKLQRTTDLKFGIHKILSDEFGKEKEKKGDRTESRRSSHIPGNQYRNICVCNSSCCPYTSYISSAGSSPTLSVFQSIQPPQYPMGSGSDALPGPYSILSADHISANQTKRKRSWSRAVFSNLQRKGLEKRFEVQKYVTKPDRRQLAAMLGLTDAQVKVWFQNRRMKWRQVKKSVEKAGENVDDDTSFEDGEDDEGDIHVNDPESEFETSQNENTYTSSDDEQTVSSQNNDSYPRSVHNAIETQQN